MDYYNKINEESYSYSIALGSIENSIDPEKKPGPSLDSSLNDETVLKELHLNDQPIDVFDITSLITIVEEKDSNPYGVFKCFFNKETKEFYITINELTPIKVFTRSILLNMFDFAEEKGAKIIYACIRKSTHDIAHYAQSFLFIGFEYANEENETENGRDDQHIILKLNLIKEGEKKNMPDSDDELFD